MNLPENTSTVPMIVNVSAADYKKSKDLQLVYTPHDNTSRISQDINVGFTSYELKYNLLIR